MLPPALRTPASAAAAGDARTAIAGAAVAVKHAGIGGRACCRNRSRRSRLPVLSPPAFAPPELPEPLLPVALPLLSTPALAGGIARTGVAGLVAGVERSNVGIACGRTAAAAGRAAVIENADIIRGDTRAAAGVARIRAGAVEHTDMIRSHAAAVAAAGGGACRIERADICRRRAVAAVGRGRAQDC